MHLFSLKKARASILAILSAAMLLTSCSGGNTPAETTNKTTNQTTGGNVTTASPSVDPTTPPSTEVGKGAVNFAVISDVHIGRTGLEKDPADKFADALDIIGKKLKSPDAILVVGDLTENGEDSQYRTYNNVVKKHLPEGTVLASVMGNHEYHRNGHSASAKECQDAYKKFCGDLHTDTVINGVHMIGLSPLTLMGDYTAATNYLDKQVRAAAAEDPNMPIFVYTHWGFSEVYDRDNATFGKKLNALVKEFPQIIAFSGHMHYALNDPRTIWQKDITTIQTSTVGSDFWNYRYLDPIQPDGAGTASQGLFVSVSEDKVVTVVRYDFTRNCEIGTPWVINTPEIVKSTDNFTYTEAKRKDAAAAPSFVSDAKITALDVTASGAKLKFPAASVVDNVTDGCIIGYQVDVKDKESGTSYFSKYVHNDWQLIHGEKTEFTVSVGGLDAGKVYTVSVVAKSAWDKESTALTGEFETLASGTISFPSKVLNVDYSSGSPDDSASGVSAIVQGSPVIEGGHATFDSTNCYGYKLSSDMFASLADNFALEAFVYIEKDQARYPYGYTTLFGCAQSSGFDMCLYENGKVSFDMHINGGWKTIEVDAPTGKWVHIVASYDGSTMRVFFDGKLVESASCTGKVTTPSAASSVFYVGADVDGFGKGEYPAKMQVAYISLYDNGLSLDQASQLFASSAANS